MSSLWYSRPWNFYMILRFFFFYKMLQWTSWVTVLYITILYIITVKCVSLMKKFFKGRWIIVCVCVCVLRFKKKFVFSHKIVESWSTGIKPIFLSLHKIIRYCQVLKIRLNVSGTVSNLYLVIYFLIMKTGGLFFFFFIASLS